jgi:hypothetical protein
MTRPIQRRSGPSSTSGETELVFDAALNPYARGFFDVTLQDGLIDLEEGYFSLLRGLPGDVQIKGGSTGSGSGS